MKRILSVVWKVIVWTFVAFAAAMCIFTIISTTFNKTNRSVLGYQGFIILSDSMSASNINAGDLVLTRSVDPSTLQPGDIITFTSRDPDIFGETVTHMIRDRGVDAQGKPGFITYGTTTGVDDKWVVTDYYILGKHQMTLPKVGNLFYFLKTPAGYISLILIPFLILILNQGINTVSLFRQYRKEKLEEVEQEREDLRREREETLQMREELEALKRQMALAQSTPAPADSDPPTEV